MPAALTVVLIAALVAAALLGALLLGARLAGKPLRSPCFAEGDAEWELVLWRGARGRTLVLTLRPVALGWPLPTRLRFEPCDGINKASMPPSAATVMV